MSKIVLDMDLFGGLLMVDIKLWNKRKNAFSNLAIVLDTGASMTTISKDILYRAGYSISEGATKRITTASAMEYVQEVTIDKIALGKYEMRDVLVYAHTFPQESFSSGVLGLNVLTNFDVNLIFSKKMVELSAID